MSGIEVVGLVLGAFPILVTALEHYHDSARVLDDWWSYRKRFQKCQNKVNFLHLDFRATMEQVLLPLVCDETQTKALLAEPGGPLWKDASFDNALKNRLSETYIHYIRVVEEISEVMEKLKQELGLGKVEENTSIAAHHYQRIKFSLGRTTRDELFKEFEEQNGELRRLLQIIDQRAAFKPSSGTHLRSLSMKALQSAQKRATTLYNLIAEAWNCTCKSSHLANLKLQLRRTPVSCTVFDVVFLYSIEDDTEGSKPWSCMHTSIKTVQKNTCSSSSVAAPMKGKGHLYPNQKRSLLSLKTKLKKVVFAEHQNHSSSKAKVTVEMEAHQPENATVRKLGEPPDAGDLPHISNLCLTLTESGKASESGCCGVLRKENEEYQFSCSPKALANDRVPLNDLLDGTIKTKFSVRERVEVATAIAKCTAQFWYTPWLPGLLAKDSIFFILGKNDSHNQTYSSNELCLSRKFVGKERQVELQSKAGVDRRLTSLGILLLELCFRTTIESFIQETWPTISGQKEYFTFEHAAALLWSKDVRDERGPLYSSAVEWCLQSGQATAAPSSDDWHINVYENVVLPLQECCAAWD